MSKNLICYVALFLVFRTAAYVALGLGARLEHADAVTKAESTLTSSSPPSPSPVSQSALESASSSASTSHAPAGGREPLVSLLLQVLVVIAAARVCGALFQ